MCIFLAISQETIPRELPIAGEPNVDIFLDLIFPKGKKTFFLNEKSLQLLAPLDRDEESLSHLVFQVKILSIKLVLFHVTISSPVLKKLKLCRVCLFIIASFIVMSVVINNNSAGLLQTCVKCQRKIKVDLDLKALS